MSRNREITLSTWESSTICAALTVYAEQNESADQDEARIARRVLMLMDQMNYAGECGHYELRWVND